MSKELRQKIKSEIENKSHYVPDRKVQIL